MNGFSQLPVFKNEPVLNHAPGSPEREALLAELKKQRSTTVEVPLYIGGEKVLTGNKVRMAPPHDIQHTLGHFHRGEAKHVQVAIDAALKAKKAWENLPWENRAAIFLRAADLISGPYRSRVLASTMLAQSKTVYQAEIDAVCELADFLRFNVKYMSDIYRMQPESSSGIWNRVEYRPLEGFVFALTPFNFTAIAGNLPSSAAMMGNTVVWKPADSQIYSAQVIMEIFREAGLPDGVINLIYVDGKTVGEIIFKHSDFAGIHFTGSTGVFQQCWKTIGENIHVYKNYPRIVGETGGKDFIVAHASADPVAVATAITRGAFEFQGQKCSAASRIYLSKSISQAVIDRLLADVKSFKCGSPEDLKNFFTAVIDERAFDKITGYIEQAKKDANVQVLAGGKYDKTKGYFIEPTVLLSKNPQSVTMCEEIFGPVVTLYVFEDKDWEKTLELVDKTSPYALTGAVFSNDRYALQQAMDALRHAAGNFYINDKPTGAVVNQQPFGGSRASGTNDKAGSMQNLLRWVSVRTIKETLVPPTDYTYPFMK